MAEDKNVKKPGNAPAKQPTRDHRVEEVKRKDESRGEPRVNSDVKVMPRDSMPTPPKK